jgi:hypothetical protein
MINLTKERGFGALAHEYGHALDYFFGTYIDRLKGSASLSGGSTTRRTVDLSGGKIRILTNKTVNLLCASDSYKVWLKKSSGDYWIRRNEIFARTFEMWVAYRARQKKISNSFLIRLKYESDMYPQKNDFMKVLPFMNLLVHDMSLFMNNKK